MGLPASTSCGLHTAARVTCLERKSDIVTSFPNSLHWGFSRHSEENKAYRHALLIPAALPILVALYLPSLTTLPGTKPSSRTPEPFPPRGLCTHGSNKQIPSTLSSGRCIVFCARTPALLCFILRPLVYCLSPCIGMSDPQGPHWATQ